MIEQNMKLIKSAGANKQNGTAKVASKSPHILRSRGITILVQFSGLVALLIAAGGCAMFAEDDSIREREELRQTHPKIYETERHQKASEWEKEQQERESSGRPR